MDLDEFWMSFLGEAAESELQFPRSETFSDTRTRKKRAPTLRESDWAPYKGRIIQLYFTEKRPLSEVRTLIEQEFGFIATVRQYRSRLTRWKLDKNVKPEEMKAIVRLRQQRSLVESDKRDLKFRVRGQEVEPQNIERWLKRHDAMESALYATSSAVSTPSAVSYETMSETRSPRTPSGCFAGIEDDENEDENMNINGSSTTPRDLYSCHTIPQQNVNGDTVRTPWSTDESLITSRQFNTDAQPRLRITRVNNMHLHVRWRYDSSGHGFDQDFEDVMLALPQSRVKDTRKHIWKAMTRILLRVLLAPHLHMGLIVGTSQPPVLDLYVRYVPRTWGIPETLNVRIHLPVGPNSHSRALPGDCGLDFKDDRLWIWQSRGFWAGPERLGFHSNILFGWRLSRCIRLDSFVWPREDEDTERRRLFELRFG